jgi:hypothetical protein
MEQKETATLPPKQQKDKPRVVSGLKTKLLVVLFLLATGAAAVLGTLYAWNRNCCKALFEGTEVITVGWQWFVSDEYGITFTYPASWEAVEVDYVSGPMPFYKKSIYFIKKEEEGRTYAPSLFGVELYVNKEEGNTLSDNFRNFYNRENEIILSNIDDASEEIGDILEEINIGGKKAVKFETFMGMVYGGTYISWLGDKQALMIGSIGLASWPFDHFEEIGLPPYRDNEIIAQLVGSFEIKEPIGE